MTEVDTLERHLLEGSQDEAETSYEEKVRPQSLEEMVGQDRLRENLGVFIAAAKERGEPLDHVLFYGPPGLGKTSLARIISNELNARFRATSGPVLERAADLAGLLGTLEEGDILFIDEIHRLSPVVEEVLYPAMEDFRLDVLIGQGAAAQSVRLDVPRFTLVGATTRAGLLTAPMRDRFGWTARLDYYNPNDLAGVINRTAKVLQVSIHDEAANEIAKRARGTPRVANRLLRRICDFALVESGPKAVIDVRLAGSALTRLDVDEVGFDSLDRALLSVLVEKFGGGPVGIDTLAAALGEDRGTLEDLVEPFLIQGGFLERTSRGRKATERARSHLGATPPLKPEQTRLL